MRIINLSRETAESVVFELEDESGRPVRFLPGQYLTLIIPIDGVEHRRSYSICASTEAGTVTVACKRVVDGRVSTHLTRHLTEGDRLDALGPAGGFTLRPDPRFTRELLLVGGGSGITPLMAIARAVLRQEPASQVTLVYGNRSLEETLFTGALAELAAQHPIRFTVRHVVERAPAGWSGGTGRLDPETFGRELDRLDVPVGRPHAEAFICGPEPMMQAVRGVLAARGMAPANIHIERFTPAARPEKDKAPEATLAKDGPSSQPHPLTIRYGARVVETVVQPGQTLLQASACAGELIPFSCESGTCGSCKVKVHQGSVDMPEDTCLMPDERAQGYALSCVSKPLSPLEVEVQD